MFQLIFEKVYTKLAFITWYTKRTDNVDFALL